MKVSLPYDPTWQALTWAKRNCPSYITNDADTETNIKEGYSFVTHINYYFGNENEALMFKLRWA